MVLNYMEPIEIWKKIINSESNEQEIQMRLKEVYRNNRPLIAEIIMNSHCPNRCLHCIYPPDYAQYNKNMSWEEWKTAFQIIYEKLGMKRFIFDGRTITRECIQAIRLLKTLRGILLKSKIRFTGGLEIFLGQRILFQNHQAPCNSLQYDRERLLTLENSKKA